MNLSTTVEIPQAKRLISHNDSSLVLGSCFAENIGNKLISNKFNTLVNPFGIIYNPLSISKNVTHILNNTVFNTNDLYFFNNKWLSFQHHGSFSTSSKSDCLQNINNQLNVAHKQLKNVAFLFITFGSAWVYEHKEVGLVANCHKIPAKQFSKRLLTEKEIVASYETLINRLKTYNPAVHIVFTISPVRHTKDGLWENNLSKAVLHLSVKALTQKFENCAYFPSYEIVIDELRDYRFFKDDLIHPTELATNYVWEKFSLSYFSKETKDLIQEIQKIQQAASHKPFDFSSEKHQQFIKNQLTKINELKKRVALLNFKNEEELLGRI